MVMTRIDGLYEMARAACAFVCGICVIVADEANMRIYVAYVPDVDNQEYGEIKAALEYTNGDLAFVYRAALGILTSYATGETVH